MAKSNYYRWLVRAALVAGVLPLIAIAPVVAQENGGREDRGDRGDGGWRRNGDRPRGDGPRGRDRDDRSSDRPADTKPAPLAAPTPTSFGTTSDTEKIRKSASDTIKQHDKSGDGILAGDELSELGMSKAADVNADGKITHDELVAFRTPKTTTATTTTVRPTTTTAASSDPEAAKPGERKLVNDTRKSYRFKSTKDRLPSWRFAERDKNGDGQVSMSEYSRNWSDRTAAEFQRYDTDQDGMITSQEVR